MVRLAIRTAPLQDRQLRVESLDEPDLRRELMHGADATARDRMTALPDLVVNRVCGELGSVSSWCLSTLCGGQALGAPPPSSPDLDVSLVSPQTSCALLVAPSQPFNTPASRFDPEKWIAGFGTSRRRFLHCTHPPTVLARPTERRARTRRSSGRRGLANVGLQRRLFRSAMQHGAGHSELRMSTS